MRHIAPRPGHGRLTCQSRNWRCSSLAYSARQAPADTGVALDAAHVPIAATSLRYYRPCTTCHLLPTYTHIWHTRTYVSIRSYFQLRFLSISVTTLTTLTVEKYMLRLCNACKTSLLCELQCGIGLYNIKSIVIMWPASFWQQCPYMQRDNYFRIT